jgi:ABC-type antimicrobial peptide transport system permease subunit
MAKQAPNDKAVIRQLIANTEELLNKNYANAYTFRDQDDVIKISFTHKIAHNEFAELIAKSTIAFSKRLKFETEHAVDVTEQPKLNLT